MRSGRVQLLTLWLASTANACGSAPEAVSGKPIVPSATPVISTSVASSAEAATDTPPVEATASSNAATVASSPEIENHSSVGPATKNRNGNVVLGAPTVDGVTGAGTVVARLRPRLRRCYARALLNDPTIKGELTLVVEVGPKGDVLSVNHGSSNAPAQLIACIVRDVSVTLFPTADKPGATVTIPMVFVPPV